MHNIIIAIDPGYDRCGVAIISDGALAHSTCIITNKKDSHEKRLTQIYETITTLIQEWHPTHLAVETLFFSTNKKTAIKVAEARGVIILLAGIHNIELLELSPQDVKLAMAGVGNADKKQVQKMVAMTLKIDISDKLDDEIDAIALGYAALGLIRVNQMGKR